MIGRLLFGGSLTGGCAWEVGDEGEVADRLFLLVEGRVSLRRGGSPYRVLEAQKLLLSLRYNLTQTADAVGYTNLTTHTRLTDAHNGLRAIRRPVVEKLDITQNRMAHASELVAQIGALKASYVEHPVHILYTDYSKAKGQSLWNSINILAELILR